MGTRFAVSVDETSSVSFRWYAKCAGSVLATGFEHDAKPRSQFHHVIDVAPTIYEVAGIVPPDRVNGIEQMPLDGTSMRYAFDSSVAPSQRTTQYFEILGNRGIYHEGWMASVSRPLTLDSLCGI